MEDAIALAVRLENGGGVSLQIGEIGTIRLKDTVPFCAHFGRDAIGPFDLDWCVSVRHPHSFRRPLTEQGGPRY